ncbi:hypothetical protein PoB_005865500 [Plakobranchus ocellatus]|uniref:Peptidase A2 domain-containing protein n=1 Tax=Plakobranchus ocellatus TaxID=259542 RepID=A0AAV4CJX3_9GAST|nr:hypothetical protein PoB_005865500 [Plakobranchus ocellatus]
MSVGAIIDTNTEITVIPREVCRRIFPKPSLHGKRLIRMAGKSQSSWTNLADPISIRIRSLRTQEKMHVAQINDEMLLVVDYLDKYNNVSWG